MTHINKDEFRKLWPVSKKDEYCDCGCPECKSGTHCGGDNPQPSHTTCQVAPVQIGLLHNDMPRFMDKLYGVLREPQETDEHHAVDDGFCSCGALCETGTRFREHLREVQKK